MSFLCQKRCTVLWISDAVASCDLKKLFNGVNVLVHAGHAFSAATVLPLCITRCINLQQQLVRCWMQPFLVRKLIQSFFLPYPVLKLTILSSLVKTILTCQVIKNVNITSLLLQAGWLNIAKLENLVFQYQF